VGLSGLDKYCRDGRSVIGTNPSTNGIDVGNFVDVTNAVTVTPYQPSCTDGTNNIHSYTRMRALLKSPSLYNCRSELQMRVKIMSSHVTVCVVISLSLVLVVVTA